MSSLQRDTKIYGAVESENYITFTGFCKKIYDTTQQSVDVFLDDNKIDTILANEKIVNIENKYEVFDTNGFCFTYELPKEYIGQKHKLEFKTKDGEQLLHSPTITISSEHDFYNEWLFLESLNKSILEEKNINKYSSNSIGFLLTEESQTDIKYLSYLKELTNKFPNITFKGFCFNESQKKSIMTINRNICVSIVSNPQDFISSVDIFISSVNFKGWKKLVKCILENSSTVPIIYDGELVNIKLSKFDFQDVEQFGFTKEEQLISEKNLFKLLHIDSFRKYHYQVDIEQYFSTQMYFDNIKLAIYNSEFKERLFKVMRYLCKDF